MENCCNWIWNKKER